MRQHRLQPLSMQDGQPQLDMDTDQSYLPIHQLPRPSPPRPVSHFHVWGHLFGKSHIL